MVVKGVLAWLLSMARCLTPLEVFLVVLVDMDVLTRCKVVMADLQALVDTLLMVKLETTEDTRPDASFNSTWASGQPFDTRMFCPFGILSLSVILRIIFRSSSQTADTGWLSFTASPFEFRISDLNVL